MKPRFAIGNSTFPKLRGERAHFVDKSLLIADVVRNPQEVILLPRPRRFGKTLALTMLQAWFDPHGADAKFADHTGLFEDLAVWQAGDDVRATFGGHPVILLSFKDVKAKTWGECRAQIAVTLAGVAIELRQAYDLVAAEPEDAAIVQQFAGQTASDANMQGCLKVFSRWLAAATGSRVVVLIDEYDTPIQEAWLNGYYDEVVPFFRGLFSAGLMDNVHLYRGVLTGILRVSKESLFSGLNNLAVYTVLSPECATRFGFTPTEVAELARLCELDAKLPGIDQWYNGYCFGGEVIYNPWSVLYYLAHPRDGLKPHWVNTASDGLLRDLLVRRNTIGLEDFETLLAGGSVRRVIDEHMVLRGIEDNTDAVWALLLFSGYLKATDVTVEAGETYANLAVPNLEVQVALARLFEDHLKQSLGPGDRVRDLCRALLAGDEKTLARLLRDLAKAMLSYHDVAARPTEAVYQAFILGLPATLERTHEVTSNRESGYGRYDVLVCPRVAGEAGAVFELKEIDEDDGETAQSALQAAVDQLTAREYATALRERGANPVWQYAVVFEGKRVWVRAV